MRTLVITILTGTGTTFNTAKLSGCRQSSRVSLQQISLWDIRENKVLAVIKGHEDMVTDVGFLPCPDHKSSPIVVSVGDATCRIWDALQVEAKQLQCLKQHDNDYEVECLAISPDGSLLATGGRDNKIVLSTVTVPEDNLEKLYHENTEIPKGQQLWRKAALKAFASVSSFDGDTPGSESKTSKSSGALVDSAKQRTEMLKLEKSKMAAKQTVRVKSPATSNVLQAKITLLKSTSRDDSRTTVPAMEIGPRTSSVSNTDIQGQLSKLRSVPSGEPQAVGDIGSLRYKSRELEAERRRLRSVSGRTFVNDGTNNQQVNGTEYEQKEPSREESPGTPIESADGSRYYSSSGESYEPSLYEEIEDVTQEMIRISDEQQLYVNEEDYDSRL